MRILSIHNRYQIRGGEEEVYEGEIELLRSRGHSVHLYQDCNSRIKEFNNFNLALKTIWSQKAYEEVSDRLSRSSFDVVHVHNFFPLISPSIYYAAKARGIPVVQTLHNYRLICPNGLLFRQGRVCEDCLGERIPWSGAWYGCYRKNKAASLATVGMIGIHRTVQTWNNLVDKYIVLTEFAKQKFVQGGLPETKIVVKPNFVDCDPEIGLGNEGYMLYVGRLSEEKGLDILLSAWELLDSKVPLKIVGDGPLSGQVIEATQKLAHIEWLGRQPTKRVYELMGKAISVIIPSKWYETFGRVVTESYAQGTPVIASNIGAIAELVENRRTGLHFQPGIPEDLAAQVDWAMTHPQQLALMRRAARAEYEAKYTAETNYQHLMNIYQNL